LRGVCIGFWKLHLGDGPPSPGILTDGRRMDAEDHVAPPVVRVCIDLEKANSGKTFAGSGILRTEANGLREVRHGTVDEDRCHEAMTSRLGRCENRLGIATNSPNNAYIGVMG
jgi:hypothetical protein